MMSAMTRGWRTARSLASRLVAPHHPGARGAATVSLLEMAHPGDTSGLAAYLEAHPQARPRCVLGKTEGNGCVNDFTRGYASHVVETTMGDRCGDASIIMSGGTEGILTPHLLIFADDDAVSPGPSASPRLSMGVARTRTLLPHELGRRAQIEATRDAVLAACADASLAPSELRFVQIKCPLLSPERVLRSEVACATEDGYYSMALSRGASALGVGLATGEVPTERLPRDDAEASRLVCAELSLGSSIASCSAGIELDHSEIFVLGNSAGSTSPLRAAACVMSDALDAPSVVRMLLDDAQLEISRGQLTEASRRRVRAVLAKADPAPSVRGHRTTMCADSDLHATRHSRAAVDGLLGGIFGETRLYVSGGAEHQGPQGGGPVCVIYECSPES